MITVLPSLTVFPPSKAGYRPTVLAHICNGQGDGTAYGTVILECEGASFVATFDKNRNATNEETPSLLWHFEPRPDGSVIPTWTTLTPLQIFVGLVEDGLDSCGDIAQEMGTTKGWVSKLAKRAETEGLITIDGRRYISKK